MRSDQLSLLPPTGLEMSIVLIIVAYGLWDDGLVWLIGTAVCLLDAPRVELFELSTVVS